MKGIVGRVKVRRIDAESDHFFGSHSDDEAGTISITLAPRSQEDRKLILALLRESIKNGSWVEIGGGAGTLVDSRTANPPPLESPLSALGPIVSEQ
jgi:hypothetical protein